MVFNSAIIKNTSTRDKELLAKVMGITTAVRDFIDTLPQERKMSYECHSISRALALSIPELTLVDGNLVGLERIPQDNSFKFELRYASHSWLLTPDDAIIDPYPVGYLTVNAVLVVNKGIYAPFGGRQYVADKRVTNEISSRKIWRKSQMLYELIQEALKHEKKHTPSTS